MNDETVEKLLMVAYYEKDITSFLIKCGGIEYGFQKDGIEDVNVWKGKLTIDDVEIDVGSITEIEFLV